MAKERLIRQNNHLYYFKGRYATRPAANKAAKSWQQYGSLTIVKPRKEKYLYPTAMRTVYLLYATRNKINK